MSFDFPSLRLGFSFPRFAQKENSAAPRNSMNNNVNSTCVNAVGRGEGVLALSKNLPQDLKGVPTAPSAPPIGRVAPRRDDEGNVIVRPPDPAMAKRIGMRSRKGGSGCLYALAAEIVPRVKDELEPAGARVFGADQRSIGPTVRIGRDVGDERALAVPPRTRRARLGPVRPVRRG